MVVRASAMLILLLMLAACGSVVVSTFTEITRDPSIATPTAEPTGTLPPEAPTATPTTTVALSGTGDKTGPAVTLAGDYTITAKVTANPGCAWTLSVKPGNDDVVNISTDAAGSQETSLPISLAPGSYQLVVTSTSCGDWTVSLAR